MTFFFYTDDNLIKLRRILHILNKEVMLWYMLLRVTIQVPQVGDKESPAFIILSLLLGNT